MAEWFGSNKKTGDRDPAEVLFFDISLVEVEVEGKKRMSYVASWSDRFIETVLKKYTPERLATFQEEMIEIFKDSLKREIEA